MRYCHFFSWLRRTKKKKRTSALRCVGSLRFGLKYRNLIEIRTCRHVRRSILILLLYTIIIYAQIYCICIWIIVIHHIHRIGLSTYQKSCETGFSDWWSLNNGKNNGTKTYIILLDILRISALNRVQHHAILYRT